MMVVLLVIALVAVDAFLAWIFYDCGFDSGYTKAWNEAHPPRAPLFGEEEEA